MRHLLFAGSVLVSSLVLTACQIEPSEKPQAAASIDDLKWNGANAKILREAINNRRSHGLDHLKFDLPDDFDSPNAQDQFTKSALRYADALANGASRPAKLYPVYTLPRQNIDLKRGLTDAIANDRLKPWLESLAPQTENYRKLSAAYLNFVGDDAAPKEAIPSSEKELRPSERDSRIPAIAAQLAASDYLASADGDGDLYSAQIADAVRRMQADFGIKPDGVIGQDALKVLNLSNADRARAIAVAMERMRWLERNAPATRIDVNLAAARLTYWRDGKIADTRKVIVGDPDTETPQLGSPIFRLVANPTWTVPRSIERKEIAAKGKQYLKQHNMIWKDGWIVQESGPQNSLGLVKFDMQNDHQIYLHDTPAKQLFQEAQRQRSHGCVRVDDALGFADMLAKDNGVTDEWRKARETGEETFVSLPQKLPVRLFYQTVLFGQDGAPVIRADPYGWDDRVAKTLGFAARDSLRLNKRSNDLAP